jgi:hypothetical protein
LGSDVYRRKENVHEKSVFKGSVLPQKTTSKPVPAKFSVFRDDVCTYDRLSVQDKSKVADLLKPLFIPDGNRQ